MKILNDLKCEQCGKEIEKPEPNNFIWVSVEDSPGVERPAYFCSDDCLNNWWKTPTENPCNV